MKSDVYSLAVTFVHLLTGKPIYDCETSSEYDIQVSIVTEPIDLSSVPTNWRGFLAPYLDKDPQKRPVLRNFETVELKEEPVAKPQLQPAPIVEAPKEEKPASKSQPRPIEAKAQPKSQVEEMGKPYEKRKSSVFWKRTKLPWMLVFLYVVLTAVIWYGISNGLELPYSALSTIIIFLGLLAIVILFLVSPEKLKVLPYIILAITIGAFFISAPVYLRLAIPILALSIVMIVRDSKNKQK
jgi:serine/threonine protein kinase